MTNEDESIKKKIRELHDQYAVVAKQAEQKASKALLDSQEVDLKTKSELREKRMKY